MVYSDPSIREIGAIGSIVEHTIERLLKSRENALLRDVMIEVNAPQSAKPIGAVKTGK